MALIAGVVIAIVGMALSLSFGSERLMNLTLLLRSVAGLGAVYFYFHMIKRARLPNAVAYGLVALVCAFVAPLITWIRGRTTVFKPSPRVVAPSASAKSSSGTSRVTSGEREISPPSSRRMAERHEVGVDANPLVTVISL